MGADHSFAMLNVLVLPIARGLQRSLRAQLLCSLLCLIASCTLEREPAAGGGAVRTSPPAAQLVCDGGAACGQGDVSLPAVVEPVAMEPAASSMPDAAGSPAPPAPAPTPPPAPVCDCDGRKCGQNACGDSCGACGADEACDDGVCRCIPDCAGRTCGDDGCGGSCGSCETSQACDAKGQCACREGACPGRQVCHDGACCEPALCRWFECGRTISDGCGGVVQCQACPEPPACDDRDELCSAQCPACAAGRGCDLASGRCQRCDNGNDTCNADCPRCAAGKVCNLDRGRCVACERPGRCAIACSADDLSCSLDCPECPGTLHCDFIADRCR